MADPVVEDLFALDRDVARGAEALERWREVLRRDPGATEDAEPLEPVRHVAGKTTWVSLGEAEPSAGDAPLRDALRHWVVALTQARIGAPAELARARAAAAPKGRFEGDPAGRLSWNEAWRGLASASGPLVARSFLEAAADAAAGVKDAARLGASRRLEVARRFGFEHPCEGLVGVGAGPLLAAAKKLLDATEAVHQEAWRAIWRMPGATPAATMFHAVAREAGEGWPAHLAPRWFADVLSSEALRGWAGPFPEPPSLLGAASFARALGDFGRAYRVRRSTRAPFALAREPAGVAAHRFELAFAALAADAEWQRSALGVGRRTAREQSRVLARSALLAARLHAARLLLGDEANFAPRDLFEELSLRLFGGPLDPRLRGAWPAARSDEPGRFVALLQTPGMLQDLREGFDVDWFRNPRAWEALRASTEAPAREAIDPGLFEGQVARVAGAFEEALG